MHYFLIVQMAVINCSLLNFFKIIYLLFVLLNAVHSMKVQLFRHNQKLVCVRKETKVKSKT